MVTKCRESRFRGRLPLGLFILTTILVWVVAGCQGKTPTPIAEVKPPVISDPKVCAPTPLKPGEEAGISVDIVSCPAEITLTYEWIVEEGGGKIIKGQESPAITYRAPDQPGIYNVRVVVNWDDQKVEKDTFITIEEEPTPTDTPLASIATLVPPTDTPVPSADITPTLQPTPPPPSEALAITDPSRDAEVGTPVTVKGKWIEVAERGDWNLEVLVRSLQPNEPYWVQPDPDIADDGTWQSRPVHVGRPGKDVGIRFEICVVATGLDLREGEQLFEDELPEGPNFCILVTRK